MSSLSNKGTLTQLASRFRHTGVKEHVEAAVHDCREHLRFVTEGLAVLAAMSVLGWDDKDISPEGDSATSPQNLLESVADSIMEKFVLVDYRDPAEILSMREGASNKTGNTKARVPCGFPGCPKSYVHDGRLRRRHRSTCPYQRFQGLLNQDEQGPDIPQHQPGEPSQQTQHQTDESPKEKPSSSTSNSEDFKHNYTCALLREGLLDWARHDAVREGDAERVMDLWKFDFLHFHLNHTNYTHIGFTLIAQQHGLVSKRMAETIRLNRFANIKGGSGHNVSLDYAMELYNGAVKPDLKGRGQLTSDTINRVGKSLKQVQDILGNYDHQVHYFSSIGRHKPVNMQDDIAKMVSELSEENLFEVHPGRYHTAFPNFPLSKMNKLDGFKLKQWLKRKKQDLSPLQRVS